LVYQIYNRVFTITYTFPQFFLSLHVTQYQITLLHTRSSFYDVDQPRNTSKDPLHVPNGPMTRSKTKALKETMNALVLNVSSKSELKGPLEYQEETLVHLIHVEEGSNTIHNLYKFALLLTKL
jgi:hypothetical protein